MNFLFNLNRYIPYPAVLQQEYSEEKVALTNKSDGTLITIDTGDVGQANPPFFPAGGYGTFAPGIWKKIGKRRYKIVQNLVFLAKDLTTRTPKHDTNPECPVSQDPCAGDLLLANIKSGLLFGKSGHD